MAAQAVICLFEWMNVSGTERAVRSGLAHCGFKVYPEAVDVAIVEGAISSVEDERKIQAIRKHTNSDRHGDCAVTAMWRRCAILWTEAVLEAPIVKCQPGADSMRACAGVLEKVRPVHEFVKGDIYLPGCPPSADTSTRIERSVCRRTPDVASLTLWRIGESTMCRPSPSTR